LRASVKYLEGISDSKITELEIPTGMPLVFELDEKLKPLARYYLGKSSAAVHAQEALDRLIQRIGVS
jgi:2,3-bisphosphoglycerate-dependent phosphoglycerate mutase